MAARGDSFKEIAEHFHVSPGTVKNNIRTIYETLMINKKGDLAQFYL
jgi:DNA-binding NarL/FixJ family response regulator